MNTRYIQFAFTLCALGAALLLAGCASTGSKTLQAMPAETTRAIDDGLKQLPLNLPRYLQARNVGEERVFFRMTDQGVWVDQKSTGKADWKAFVSWRGKDVTKDCLLLTAKGLRLCDEAQKAMDPPSLLVRREFSLGRVLVSGMLFPIAAMAVVTGEGKSVATEPTADQIAIDAVGGYVVAGLVRDMERKQQLVQEGLDRVDLQPEQLAEFRTEYPRHPDMPRLSSRFVDTAVALPASGISEQWLAALVAARVGKDLQVDTLYRLGPLVDSNQLNEARRLRQLLKANKLTIPAGIEAAYKALALKAGSFDDAYEFATAGDIDALRQAHSQAKTPREKSLAELALVKLVAPKLLNISTRIGTSGGSSVDGSKGGLLSVLFGAKLTSNAKADISYKIERDDKIIQTSQPYQVEVSFRLYVTGTRKWTRNCGFLWLSTCEGEDANHTDTYDGKDTLVVRPDKGWAGSGMARIDWRPVWGGSGIHGGALMGGTQGFTARSVRVEVVSVKVIGIAS